MVYTKRLAWLLSAVISFGGLSVGTAIGQEEGDAKPEQTAPKPAPKLAPYKPIQPIKKTVKPATRKSSKNTKAPAAATTIVQDLRREFEFGKLRKKSDYLTEKPNAEMTADVIVGMLVRKLGTNGSMDAYIKWQLLSGLPGTMPEQYAGDGIAAYMDAPPFEPRPGMSDADKKNLDREIRRVDDPADLNARLVNEVRQVDMLNEPIESYRDALWKALPDSVDTFRAGLKDLYDRGMAGITPRSQVTKVCERINTWAENAQSMEEVSALAGIVEELSRIQMPEYYETPRFNEADQKYAWGARRASINDQKRLDDLIANLDRRLESGRTNKGDEAPVRKPRKGQNVKTKDVAKPAD